MSFNEPPKSQTDAFLRLGIELESEIMQAGQEIREKSKSVYLEAWLDSRLILLSFIRYIQAYRSGVPGITDDSISNRLQLIAQYAQGACITETTISEGLYVKANAVLKQDYEILTRIREYKADAAIVGKTPNVKHAPPGSRRFYGDMNSVAHPSNPRILASLTKQLIEGEIAGVSSCPIFLEEVAKSHYEFHVWITLEVARESFVLATEMYPDSRSDLIFPMKMFMLAVSKLESAGFIIEYPNQ